MEQTKSWIRKTWDKLKRTGPLSYVAFIHPPKIAHPGAIHGGKVIITHHWGKTYRGKRPALPSNHERYVISHARKIGISTTEYKRKFCA